MPGSFSFPRLPPLSTLIVCGLFMLGTTACSPSEGAQANAPVSQPAATAPSAVPDAAVAVSADFALVKASFGLLEAVAGKGETDSGNEWLPAFEGGPAVSAELSRPHMALADAAGNVYIADKEAHAIRRVSPDGIITTVAGTNQPGNGGDAEQPATAVALSNPNGIWVQPDGTFYVLDLDNSKIRKVTPAGVMRTLFSVEPALLAGRGLWVAPDESEAFVCSGQQLYRWTPATGAKVFLDTFVDLGMVVKDDTGRLWLGDRGANRIYEIRGGEPFVRAGDGSSGVFVDGRPAISTSLAGARAVWPYAQGFFVGLHDGSRVVYVDAEGIAHTFLNGSRNAHSGDGEPFDSPGLKVSELRSLAVAPNGNLILVENDKGYVRVVRAQQP